MRPMKSLFWVCVGVAVLTIAYIHVGIVAIRFYASGKRVLESRKALDKRTSLRGSALEPPPISQIVPASGQHLLLDMQGGSFDELNDEDFLREAVVRIIEKTQMTLLGIQSAKLNPQGVSVVAMLSESHLSIHTWPENGSALIDLFTCGDKARLHKYVDYVVDQFTGDIQASTYSILPRGWFPEDSPAHEDIQFYPVEIMTSHKYKKKVVQVQSQYQTIAIYDHHDTAEDDFGDRQTRSLYLDGVIQSNVDDEERYHESLVHPAFTAAATPPKRVLIVGGGEGGTLRETLKYKSVEVATMVDLDAKVIELSRKYLPSYSNCTGYGTPSCFDDPRADVYAQDFFKWFDEHLGSDICDNRDQKGNLLYDVIILDLLDPEELPPDAPFAKHLYSDEFFKKISCSLTSQGVLVSNFGEAPEAPFDGGPPLPDDKKHPQSMERISMFENKLDRIQTLSKKFHFTRVYDATVPSYRANWAFVLGMVPRVSSGDLTESQIRQGRDAFDGSPKSINKKLKDQLLPGAVMEIYSGSVHHGFQYPTGDWLGVWCLKHLQDCKTPLKFFEGMDSDAKTIWHPLVDSIRDEVSVTV